MPKLIYQDSTAGERTLALGQTPVLIGRGNDCQAQTQDALVSRRHARLSPSPGGYVIEDLGSSNGVYVAGQRITQPSLVLPGQEIRCGTMVLRIVVEQVAPPAAVAAPVPAAGRAVTPQGTAALDPQGEEQTDQLAIVAHAAVPVRRTQPPQAVQEDGERRRLEAALAQAQSQVNAAEARAQAAEAQAQAAEARANEQAQSGKDTARLERRIEQLQAELRRLRGGAPAALPSEEHGAVEQALQAVTSERDALRDQVSSLQQELARRPAPGALAGRSAAPAGATALDAATAEQLGLLGDLLGDLRGNLRAADEELGALGERPGAVLFRESLAVAGEAVRSASAQLDEARGKLREVLHRLGLD